MSIRPLFVLLILAAAIAPAAAQTGEAENRLRAAVDEVSAIASRATSNAQLARSVRPVLERHISFEVMTRRAIGPGWRQFTPAQQKEATELFTTLIVRTYAGKFTIGEKPSVTYRSASTPSPGRVEIPTTLLYKGSRYAVTYRLEAAEGWKITDIVAEGVSFIANYRSQFDAQYKKGGPAAVLKSLQQSVATVP